MLGLAVPVLLLAATGASMTAPSNPLPAIPYEKVTLSNGLTVILVEDHSVPLVAVNINYMVGSKNEKPGRTGFAHLFEHMMFQGSKHWNDDYFKPLQEIGGNVNGGTNTDRTRYWEVVPAAYLERALWLEADRMGFLLDAMTPERLANQISVVQNERRQNYDNRPYGTVREKIMALLFPPNHPYSWLTIGSMADLQAATLDDVKEFFRTYYTPNNASLCIVGDFAPEQAKQLVEKCFGAIPPGPPVTKLSRWVPRLDADITLSIQDRVQLPRTYVAWLTTPVYSTDDAALDVFAHILGGGKTSRLYKRLVYERQIAQEASAAHMPQELAGTFHVLLTPRPGHTLEELEREAFAVLEEALANGISAEELGRTQTAITATFLRSMENIGGFDGISDKLNEYYHYLGDVDRYRWDLQRYLDLTPARVVEVARNYLRSPHVTARVMPAGNLAPSTSELATAWDRAAMPGPGEARPFRVPPPTRFALANGLEVLLVEHHELPLVAMRLVVRAGSAADPADRPGLASLTAALLQEGAAGKSATEISELLEALGAEVAVTTEQEATFVSLSSLKMRLAESVQLFGDLVARPDFPAEELARQRTRRLVQLRQLLDQPQYLGQVTLQRTLFADHPFSRPSLGTPEGIAAITLEDVQRFWRSHFVPGRATLVVVGDVTAAECQPLLERALGSWRGEEAALQPLPAPRPLAGRAITIVDRPGAAQSFIAVGQLGVPRTTPAYAALEVANAAFGGQFVSRLNLNLREDKGYTYGIRSRFEYATVPGTFIITTSVQTAVTADALHEILKELEDLAGRRPLSAAEVAYAQGSLVNGYARRFETPAQLAAELAETVLYGLPPSALESFPKEVTALSPAEVAERAAGTLTPDRLSIVVVGDAKVVRKALAALAIAPVVVVDQEGKPLPAS
jgi:zinc protease